jgi:hypothetical protein
VSYDYNTIDGLLVFLEGSCADRRWAEAIRALVVERDALKETIVLLQSRAESSEALNSTAVSIISQRDALKQRVAELEAQRPADRDLELRERLVCAALQRARTLIWSTKGRSGPTRRLHAVDSCHRRDAEGGGMSDWMAGMSDFQREEVARMESRAHSCEARFESLHLDEIDWKKERKQLRVDLAARSRSATMRGWTTPPCAGERDDARPFVPCVEQCRRKGVARE